MIDAKVETLARDDDDLVSSIRPGHESEEQYRLLVETSPIMVVVHVEGRIEFINRAGCEMVGIKSPDDVIGRSVLDFVPADRMAMAQARMDASRHAVEPMRGMEQRLVRTDGQIIDIEVSGVRFPFRGKTGTLMVALDVSARKHGEAERQALEERLQTSQRLEAVGRLAGGVAHDFNNLLMIIMGCADGLLRMPSLSDEVRAELSDMSDAARRAGDLTRQLLAFSRKQVMQPRLIHLPEIVNNAGRLLGRVLGEDIELAVQIQDRILPVFADPGQLEQVLINLAVNARDAMPNGGRLVIEISNVDCEARVALPDLEIAPGHYVLLTVSDTGHGMDPVTRSRAFEPFFTTKSAQGTGLGLATVYGIVKQSGGYIQIDSERDVGTLFRIYLPAASSGAVVAVHPRTSENSLRGKETILLVEDEEPVRNVVCKILRRAGFEVLVAADVDDALRIAEHYEGAIDLLLTDVVMPKMNGRQLAEKLVEWRSTTKVLFMSGYTPDTMLLNGTLEQEVHFIQKPLTADQLLAKVRTVFDA